MESKRPGSCDRAGSGLILSGASAGRSAESVIYESVRLKILHSMWIFFATFIFMLDLHSDLTRMKISENMTACLARSLRNLRLLNSSKLGGNTKHLS